MFSGPHCGPTAVSKAPLSSYRSWGGCAAARAPRDGSACTDSTTLALSQCIAQSGHGDRFIWSRLGGRAGRSGALLAGVLVATTGFTVLTGATATGRLEVTGTVDANARAAYDILVRPKGVRAPPWRRTRRSSAPTRCPASSAGSRWGSTSRCGGSGRGRCRGPDRNARLDHDGQRVDPVRHHRGLIDKKLDQQVIRVDPTFTADRGLSKAV